MKKYAMISKNPESNSFIVTYYDENSKVVDNKQLEELPEGLA